ncbi:M48 family metallopeptidase [Lysobacter sp. SG-8]|uniref:M48 family metallopeptidase n=1 Tax=Marilutibacter penaei TaxID=2759900 RepID=A0A7W3U484_9GAMM|nr:M48 family metallopeptidase [Lysobacter penaei]MBB1088662.1 M48 family metallopeptidase [Lysobacter penaei]
MHPARPQPASCPAWYALAVGGVLTLLLAGCATTTSPTGRTQVVGAVSQEQLQQMGIQAFDQAKQQGRISGNAAQTRYVRCVVDSLTRQLPAGQASGWDVALFIDPSPNAFALPGGKIGVNDGIFKVAKNQDQLATVIAHEIGHVIAHHHDERITRQVGAQTGLGLLGALVGSQYGQGAASATQQFGGAAVQGVFLLPNNRTQESEADVVGQRLMAEAGYDPHQAVDLWQHMMEEGGGQPPEWLSTHPSPGTRISELERRADGLAPTYRQAQAAGRTPKCG